MSYLHWSSSVGCAGGYSQDKLPVSYLQFPEPDVELRNAKRVFSRSVQFDVSLAPLDSYKRCQFFYSALFVPGPPALLVSIARLVFADNVLDLYDKEWLIDCARALYFDLTGHEMEVDQ